MNRIIAEAEFDKEFTPTALPNGELTTSDIQVMRSYPENRVWSLVDNGDGSMSLVSGFATVNFVEWMITEEPHNVGNYDITVELDD